MRPLRGPRKEGAGSPAIVTLNADVADDVLKKAVEDQDYPVIDIQ